MINASVTRLLYAMVVLSVLVFGGALGFHYLGG